ncbi:MAG: ABC transporter permease [Gammaproteobacteria bacterium]|nr:ABC transporter permease [Gammaproteobacteria bacterium]NNF61524.1 ABC transporter permease [Gammaproteobacteria bacterium]NNM19924.1 ABC transporter permease [Gammaproteobacteria bacterium]
MRFLNWLAQIVSVTHMNLRNVPARPSSTIVAMLGIAGVVAVLVAVLSIAAGFRSTLETTGSEDAAIVLRSGSTAELSSGLSADQVRIIAEAPGVRAGADGPLASAELFVVVDAPKRGAGTPANVPLRGVGPNAFEVRDSFALTKGRRFESGLREVIVGAGAAREFSGLDVGATLKWGSNEWMVVGEFEDGGSLSESEIWTDVRVLQDAYNRGSSFQSMRVKLENPDMLQTFSDALSSDARLNVTVERESEFYAGQAGPLARIIESIGWVVTAMMGLGAIFAAILTMYAAVSARTIEIATLRALGFGRIPIVVSVLVEALVLGLIGGLIGGVLAYIGFNGYQASTLNWSSFSQVTFAFSVTPALIVTGMIYALVMGFVGGLIPSWRAASMPITAALREL